MKPEMLLDYAIFQLSPKRSRCELFVSSNGKSEKLASGLVKPFVTHLKVAEEQVALSVQSIKLEVERRRSAETWFSKGTLERFVRFVSTPEILELVNTFDAEMSQLEAAQRLYSQGAGDQLSGTGEGGSGITAASDTTKKELLRAIDVRLAAVRQDLTTASTRAAAAGFNLNTVSELHMFADRFGARRLSEACTKFISLCEKQPALVNPWKGDIDDRAVRFSYGSDMSIDEDPINPEQLPADPHQQSRSHPANQVIESTQSSPSQCSRESSIDREDTDKDTEAVDGNEKKEENSSDQADSAQARRLMRRLSVQDRISLFENKQKEGSGSGGNSAVGKPVELRRQASDVPDKAVLKRWSGASDMSIELSGEKNAESPLCTPSSASASHGKSEEQKVVKSSDSATSGKPEFRSFPSRVVDSGLKEQAQIQYSAGVASGREEVVGRKQVTVLSNSNSGDAYEASKSSSNLCTVDSDGWKDQICGKSQSKSSASQAGDDNHQADSEGQFRSLLDGKTRTVEFSYQGEFKGPYIGNELSNMRGRVNSDTQIGDLKDQGAPQIQFKASTSKDSDQLPSRSHVRAPQRTAIDNERSEGGSTLRSRDSFASQFKEIEGDITSSQVKWRSSVESEEAEMKELNPPDKLIGSSVSNAEDSKPLKMKFEKQASDPEQEKKVRAHGDESNSFHGNGKALFSAKIVPQPPQGSDSSTTPPTSQVQRLRQSKGNQELNDELKSKANELEKLFAEHKLRVPGDSSATRRSRAPDMQSESLTNMSYRKPVADSATAQLPDSYGSSNYMSDFSVTPMTKTVDNQNYEDDRSNKFSDLSLSEGSRGKFYDMYMQKRNEKLREEWSCGRAEKEAKLKTMQDRFECSRAEMKDKFAGSTDRRDTVSTGRRHAGRLRLLNTLSHMGREQQRLYFGQSDDEEDLADMQEQEVFAKDRTFSDASPGNDLFRNAAGKKLLPPKSLSSSTPRTSAAPVPKSASKASNISSGRQKLQSENPLAQSVPNFTATRKGNTKPSGASKTSRPQLRNYSHSKSTYEEAALVKEEKSRQQSQSKSSANPGELRETSPRIPEDADFAPSNFEEESELGSYDGFQKHIEPKSFLRKGIGNDFSARTRVVKQKASLASDTLNTEEEYTDLAFEPYDATDIADDDEEEFKSTRDEGHANLVNAEGSLSPESEKMVNSDSENGDGVRSFSHLNPSAGAKLPAVSGFQPIENMQHSRGENPMPWNLQGHHPFSYPQAISDVDASADSPVGSPVSWNSHFLSQMEIDAARMRKTWGTAQKPMLVTNSSNNHYRKDMTRGLKRLLKFGRKTRGTETLVDWISATTSDGDDDAEDGRDPANRSSEDLRKSRMGLSLRHRSDDTFNDSEYFNDQVQSLQSSIPAPPANFKLREDHMSGSSIKAPRSFFSLSTFRSKGSDSKPR